MRKYKVIKKSITTYIPQIKKNKKNMSPSGVDCIEKACQEETQSCFLSFTRLSHHNWPHRRQYGIRWFCEYYVEVDVGSYRSGFLSFDSGNVMFSNFHIHTTFQLSASHSFYMGSKAWFLFSHSDPVFQINKHYLIV